MGKNKNNWVIAGDVFEHYVNFLFRVVKITD